MIPSLLRDIYHRLEDAFYSLLDFLDAHGVPVYRVHDFLDEHGIPPFPAFLVLLLLIGLLFFHPSLPSSNLVSLDLYVKGEEGDFVDAHVILYKDGKIVDEGYAADGYISFGPLEPGTYEVEVSAEGYKKSTFTITINESGTKEVTLRRSAEEKGKTWGILKIILTDEAGENIKGKVVLLYEDEAKSVEVNGETEVEVPVGVKIDYVASAPGYTTKKGSVVMEEAEKIVHISLSPSGTAHFSPAEKVPVKVKIYKNGTPQKDKVVKLISKSGIYVETTNEKGEAVFKVPPGDYNIYVDGTQFSANISKSTELFIDTATNQAGKKVQIVKDGKPVKNKTVRVDGYVVTTDEKGMAVIPLQADAKRVEKAPLSKYRLYVKVKYKDRYLNKFKVKVLSDKGTWERDVHHGLAFFILPQNKYIVKVWAYGEELTREVDLTKDIRLELSVEHPKATVEFTGKKGSVEIAGNKCSFTPTNKVCTFTLDPGEYEYTYTVEGFYPYKGKVVLDIFAEEKIDLTKIELIPNTFLPPGSEPKLVSIEAICNGKNVGVLCDGGLVRLRLHVPKAPLRVEINSPNPNVVFTNNTFSGTPTTPEVDITAHVSVNADSISTSFPVSIYINGKRTIKTFAIGRKPVALGPILLFGLEDSEDAPGGRFKKDILLAGQGEVLITPPGTKVTVSGPTKHTLSLEVNYPTTVTITSYIGGVEAGTWSFQLTPIMKEKKPTEVELLSWWFEGALGKTGKLLLPGEKLHLIFAVPDNISSISVSVKPEKEYYPQPQKIKVGTIHNNRVEVNVSFKQFLLSLSSFTLNIEMNFILDKVRKTKKFTIKPACYPWNPFHVFNDGKIFYAVVLDDSAFPKNVKLGTHKVKLIAFSPISIPGKIELRIGDKVIGVPLLEYPKEEKTSIELAKNVKYAIIWKAEGAEKTLEEGTITVSNDLNLTVCTVYNSTYEGGMKIKISGINVNGEEVTREASTGGDGCHTFTLKPGEYNVTVEDPKGIFLPAEKKGIVLRENTKIKISLTPKNEAPILEPLYMECNVNNTVLKLPFIYASCKEVNLVLRAALRPEDVGVTLEISGSRLFTTSTYTFKKGDAGRSQIIEVKLSKNNLQVYSLKEERLTLQLKKGSTTILRTTLLLPIIPSTIPREYIKSCEGGNVGYALLAGTPFHPLGLNNIVYTKDDQIKITLLIASCGAGKDVKLEVETPDGNIRKVSESIQAFGSGYVERTLTFKKEEVGHPTGSLSIYLYDREGVLLHHDIFSITLLGPNTFSATAKLQRKEGSQWKDVEYCAREGDIVKIVAKPNTTNKNILDILRKALIYINGVDGVINRDLPVYLTWNSKSNQWESEEIKINRVSKIENPRILLKYVCGACKSSGIEFYLTNTALPICYSRYTENIVFEPKEWTFLVRRGGSSLYKIEVKNNTGEEIKLVRWKIESKDSDVADISIENSPSIPRDREGTLEVRVTDNGTKETKGNYILYTYWRKGRGGLVVKEAKIHVYKASFGLESITFPEVTVVKNYPVDVKVTTCFTLPEALKASDIISLLSLTLDAENVEFKYGKPQSKDNCLELPVTITYTGKDVGSRELPVRVRWRIGSAEGELTTNLKLNILTFEHPLRLKIDDRDVNEIVAVFGEDVEEIEKTVCLHSAVDSPVIIPSKQELTKDGRTIAELAKTGGDETIQVGKECIMFNLSIHRPPEDKIRGSRSPCLKDLLTITTHNAGRRVIALRRCLLDAYVERCVVQEKRANMLVLSMKKEKDCSIPLTVQANCNGSETTKDLMPGASVTLCTVKDTTAPAQIPVTFKVST